MRIICPHCKQKTVITSRTSLTDTVQDLYVQCMNTVNCGKKMVWRLSLSHDLDPLEPADMIRMLSQRLDDKQREQISMEFDSTANAQH